MPRLSAPVGPVILASASPRRQELLSRLGLSFRVAPAALDEAALVRDMSAGPEMAEALARAKAEVTSGPPDAVIVAADTLVVLDGSALGKPRDASEAAAMLRALRGRDHQVITGVAVRTAGPSPARCGHAISTVVMRSYAKEELRAYVASGDPLDKAGAYAIQHTGFHPVDRMDGCYWNVVGLPLCVLSRLLAEVGMTAIAPGGATVGGRCSLCAPEGPCPAPPVGGW